MQPSPYEIKFVGFESLEDEERSWLMQRARYGLLTKNQLLKLTAYIELEAKVGSHPNKWLLCCLCGQSSKILRILPDAASPTGLWSVCKDCYEERKVPGTSTSTH